MDRSVSTRKARDPRVPAAVAFPSLVAVCAAATAALFPGGLAAGGSAVGGTFTRPHSAGMPSRYDNWTAAERVDVCSLNACEAYVRMRDDLANAVWPINEKLRGGGGGGGNGAAGDANARLEARLQRLDRRLRSVEQPGEYTYT